jgi:DNA-binding IclR family transcriptional regulator
MRLSSQSSCLQQKEVIQVVSRAFEILRCFDGPRVRLGNREIAERCGLPRSTVSRLTWTLTKLGQLSCFQEDRKYTIGPKAFAFGASLLVENWDRVAFVGTREQSRTIHVSADQLHRIAR